MQTCDDLPTHLLSLLKISEPTTASGLRSVVSIMGERPYLRNWLGKILQDDRAIHSIVADSYLHDNGFAKIVLAKQSGLALRLHVWNFGTSQYCEGNIHNHRWTFASKMLIGSFESETYEFDEHGDLEVNRYIYRHSTGADSYSLIYLGRARVSLRSVERIEAGTIYTMEPETMHRVTADAGFTATLVLTSPPVKDSCDLCSTDEAVYQLDREVQKLNYDDVTKYISMVYAKLGGSE